MPIAKRFRAVASDWVEVDALTDLALTELARSRGIDILIDLGGYGDGGRMPACANRLAPVQIKWVGMQSHSSGLAEMDWFMTDRWETPAGFETILQRAAAAAAGWLCLLQRRPPTRRTWRPCRRCGRAMSRLAASTTWRR